MPRPAATRAAANAPKATGREKLWAIAPVASGAGSRVRTLNSETEERPTAGAPGDWRAASAKPAEASAKDPTMMRLSLNRRRTRSTLNPT